MVGNGVSNNDISNQLCISKHTVNTHRKNISKKLQVNNIAELVKFSIVMDLL
jgi:DNA-binding CsgD family transcriptional regulator